MRTQSGLRTSEGWALNLVKYSVLVAILALMLFPYLEMIATSLKADEQVFVYPPPWFPPNPKWDNYLTIWTYIPLARYFLNSTIVALGTIIVAGLAAIPAGYALARIRFPGRRLILYIMLISQMFSAIVLLIASFRLMNALGLLDTYQGLILMNATITLPLTVWLLTGYFSTVPREIEEAALLDGAGRLRILWDHYIPIARPGILAAILFAFILAWNEFVFAVTFIQSPDMRPLTVGIYSFIGRYQILWNLLMASSLIAMLPVLLTFLLIQRHLVTGLTAGAVK
jgi:multiple sugar transport system permease protein